jgi:hypothetical protein
MLPRGSLAFALLVLSASRVAIAYGPGEAALHGARTTADFKVLVWYSRSDPLGTFKYEVYDVRKGQFTPRVDSWIQDVRAKYPTYFVLVRDVDLHREKGASEMLKVGAVVQRELMVAASFAGIVIGEAPTLSRGAGAGIGLGSSSIGGGSGLQLNRAPRSIGVNRDFLNPVPTPFPMPVPFPRRPP